MIRYLLVNVKAPNFYTLTIHNYPFNIIHLFFSYYSNKKRAKSNTSISAA